MVVIMAMSMTGTLAPAPNKKRHSIEYFRAQYPNKLRNENFFGAYLGAGAYGAYGSEYYWALR